MSEISMIPLDPGAPTWTTGMGASMFSNAEPLPAMTAHASPIICVPTGICRVEVTMYVPASKKMILQPENYEMKTMMS